MRLILPFAVLASPALAETPQVVADIAPIHSLVSQVMEGVGTPTLLVDTATDPHAVQLRPSQARALNGADLIIWTGPDFAPWLDRALESVPGQTSVALLDASGTHLLELGAQDEDHDDGQETDHGHDHDHGDGGHDPHAWLSPENADVWLSLIAAQLSETDPENAETYAANAEAARVRIADADSAIAETLAPLAGTSIVTFHDAFGYFAEHYEIEIIGSVAASDAAAPSAGQLSALKAEVAAHDVACLFAEPAYDPRLLETVSEGLDIPTGTLDPIGASIEPGPDHYIAMLTAIGGAIAACLDR